MTREILFRGKRVDNGEWLFGDLRHIFHGEYRAHIVDNSNGLNNGVCGLEVGPLTIGQFTGLTDKNGVKIFEGDIVLHKGECGLVGYSYDYGMFEVDFDYCFASFIDISASNCEVLGNIYDNPELLEVSGNE